MLRAVLSNDIAVVGELQRLAVVLVAQELDHGLQRVL